MKKNLKEYKYLIIGFGLIGGSIAKKLYDVGVPKINISYYDPSVHTQDFNKINTIDSKYNIVIIATPLNTYQRIFELIHSSNILFSGELKLITDAGSVKKFVEHLEPNLKTYFVSAHPIAGKELSGYCNSHCDLFADKKVILTSNHNECFCIAKELWSAINKNAFKVETLKADEHDNIYAYISHLPQLISFSLANYFDITCLPSTFTRLCNSPVDIWTDIFTYNKTYIQTAMKAFYTELSHNKYANINNITDLAIAISQVMLTISIPYLKYVGSGFDTITSLANNTIKPDTSSNPPITQKFITYLKLYLEHILI